MSVLQEHIAVLMLCVVIPRDHTTVRVKRDFMEMEGIVNQVRLVTSGEERCLEGSQENLTCIMLFSFSVSSYKDIYDKKM